MAEYKEVPSQNNDLSLVSSVASQLIIDAFPIFFSLISAWIIYLIKKSVKTLSDRINSMNTLNTPSFTTKEEEYIKSYLQELISTGFNRVTLFFLDQTKRTDKGIFADSFSTWIEVCSKTKKMQVLDNKCIYSYVSLQVNFLLESGDKYVFSNIKNGKVCQTWLESRKTYSYMFYLIEGKYVGFLLLERVCCHIIKCPQVKRAAEIAALIENVIQQS